MQGTAQAGLPEAPDLGSVMRTQMERSQGAYGLEVITDTVEHVAPANRPWTILHFTANSKISSLSGSEQKGNIIGTLDIPGGFPIYGEFTKITLLSGQCIAYFSRKTP